MTVFSIHNSSIDMKAGHSRRPHGLLCRRHNVLHPVSHATRLLASGLTGQHRWQHRIFSAVLGCSVLVVMPAWAQADSPPPAAAAEEAPIVLEANHIEGQLDRHIQAQGDAVLTRAGSQIHAGTLIYDQYLNRVTARGAVRIQHQGNTFRGDALQLALDTSQGHMEQASYHIGRTGGHGRASRVDFISRTHTVAHNATYTTCTLCSSGGKEPAWYIRARKITTDTQRDEGWAEGGTLVFKGIPLIPIPSGAGFPLSDKRRSGLLPPSIGHNARDHLTYTQPYYFNIAPNRDATLTPTVMTGRGISLGGQFRYLEQHYRGYMEADYMPADRLTRRQRWRYLARHTQTWPQMRHIPGTLRLDTRIQRVSDHDYWRHFALHNDGSSTSVRLLPSHLRLDWSHQNWSGFLLAQKWQTLQQPAPNHIIPPFDRLPQIQVRYARPAIQGLSYSLEADTTRFRSDPGQSGYPNGTRSYLQGQISYPHTRSWGYLVPTLQLHARHYHTTTPMPDGRRRASVLLPTVTLDGSLIFERYRTILGRSTLQTLEPRLFYAFTPRRNQNSLPVYDSALKDFNLASIFSANPFTGHDRLADMNALTAGATSRFYDRHSGAELAHVSAAVRRQFTTRQVRLNAADTASHSSFSDILLDASLRWSPHWNARLSWDFDPTTRRTQRSAVGISYHPGPYRTISANYHLHHNTGEQVDVGWQWPLRSPWGSREDAGRWYSVGRVYYSLYSNPHTTPAVGKGVVDAMLGLEYDACCWIARVGLRRQQTQVAPVRYNNRVMLQIEFKGLSRIGSNPVATFRDQVPYYTPLSSRH